MAGTGHPSAARHEPIASSAAATAALRRCPFSRGSSVIGSLISPQAALAG